MSKKSFENKLENKKHIIRRYLDYPKFLDMITSKSIYFSSPYQFEDELDSFVPRYANIEEQLSPVRNKVWEKSAKDIFDFLIKHTAELNKIPKDRGKYYNWTQMVLTELYLKNDVIDNDCYQTIQDIALKVGNLWFDNQFTEIPNLLSPFLLKMAKFPSLTEFNRQNILISCWHSGNTEVDAMWKLYSKNDGIMIETTANKLYTQLNLSEYESYGCKTIVDKVKYIDLLEENERCNHLDVRYSDNIYKHFFEKRHCFAFEEEIRCVIINTSENPNKEIKKHLYPNKLGNRIRIKGNIEYFIDKITISPYAPRYYADTLRNVLINMKYKKLAEKINISEITRQKEQLFSQ